MTEALTFGSSLPENWASLRLKDAATYVNRGIAPSYADGDTGLMAFNQGCVRADLSVDLERGRAVAEGSLGRSHPARLRAGDVVVNSTGRGTLGRAGLIRTDPACPFFADGHVTIIRVRKAVTDARFLAYVLGTDVFYEQANSCLAVGATNQTELNREALRRMTLRLPPVASQRAIADALDAETMPIDALVAEQIRVRRVVEERLDALRERLFDPWPTRRLKEVLLTSPTYGVLVPDFVENGVPFLRVGDLESLSDPAVPERTIDPGLSSRYGRTVLNGGEVLVSVVGSLGHSGVVPERLKGANVARAVAVLRVNGTECSPRLLAEFVRTRRYQDQARLATGSDTAQPTLGMGDLANFDIPLSRDVSELDAISRRFDVEARLAAGLTAEIDSQFALLREHRQALITAGIAGGLEALREVG
jgi:type I restriction enzyme S subunit